MFSLTTRLTAIPLGNSILQQNTLYLRPLRPQYLESSLFTVEIYNEYYLYWNKKVLTWKRILRVSDFTLGHLILKNRFLARRVFCLLLLFLFAFYSYLRCLYVYMYWDALITHILNTHLHTYIVIFVYI